MAKDERTTRATKPAMHDKTKKQGKHKYNYKCRHWLNPNKSGTNQDEMLAKGM